MSLIKTYEMDNGITITDAVRTVEQANVTLDGKMTFVVRIYPSGGATAINEEWYTGIAYDATKADVLGQAQAYLQTLDEYSGATVQVAAAATTAASTS